MSQKERERKVLLEGVKEGRLTLKEASSRLNISYRQAKRVWKRFNQQGDAGLVHKLRGKTSTQSYDAGYRESVLKRYEEQYADFGPTFAHEKLTEKDDFTMSVETLRKWLMSAGLWHHRRKRKEHRQRRARRAQFGELLQVDGSIHDWFCDGNKSCLLNIVDDATSTTLSQLDSGETTSVLLRTMRLWITRYGIPKSVYVDLKSLYISPTSLRKAEAEDDRQLHECLSVFQRVCKKLHIEVIKAYSPQAKGRVERNHGVYQDRFVKELKLNKISTTEEANKFLLNDYIDRINDKFAKLPPNEIDGHRSIESYGDLNEIFCWEYTRQVQNDWTIRFKTQSYQILKEQPVKINAKQKVTLRVYLDGTVSVWSKNERLQAEEIAKSKRDAYVKKGPMSAIERGEISRKNKSKTPWSQFRPNWLTPPKQEPIV